MVFDFEFDSDDTGENDVETGTRNWNQNKMNKRGRVDSMNSAYEYSDRSTRLERPYVPFGNINNVKVHPVLNDLELTSVGDRKSISTISTMGSFEPEYNSNDTGSLKITGRVSVTNTQWCLRIFFCCCLATVILVIVITGVVALAVSDRNEVQSNINEDITIIAHNLTTEIQIEPDGSYLSQIVQSLNITS